MDFGSRVEPPCSVDEKRRRLCDFCLWDGTFISAIQVDHRMHSGCDGIGEKHWVTSEILARLALLHRMEVA